MLIKESLAASLREEILTGRMRPGEPIVECKWAARLGAAQASVREAINILMAEGYVQKDSGRTARVTVLGTDDVRQIFELRLPLEVLAARLTAVQKLDLIDLEQTVHDMRSALECQNIRALYDRDLQFHLLICEKSGNRYIAPYVRRLIVPLFAFSAMRAQDGTAAWQESLKAHQRILDALHTGDPDVAEREVTASLGSFLRDTQRSARML